MQDIKCKVCGKKIGEEKIIQGRVSIKCPRCKTVNIINKESHEDQ